MRDGTGDEIIRIVPLVQGLLDSNPGLHVTIATTQPSLYSHPRVRVIPIEELTEKGGNIDRLKGHYDVVIDFYDSRQAYSKALESNIIKSDMVRNSFLFIHASYHFTFDKVRIDHREYSKALNLNDVRGDQNVYEPVFRLMAELGLPLRSKENSAGSVINGTMDPRFEKKWQQMMQQLGNGSNEEIYQYPVVAFNPYGGRFEMKGFGRNKVDREELTEVIESIIKKGYKVIILPNGKPWGQKKLADQLVNKIPERERKSVIVAEEPSQDPLMFSHIVGRADYVISVEGGLGHTAFILGKPLGVLLRRGSGHSAWIPFARSMDQGVIRNIGELLPPIMKPPQDGIDLKTRDGAQLAQRPNDRAMVTESIDAMFSYLTKLEQQNNGYYNRAIAQFRNNENLIGAVTQNKTSSHARLLYYLFKFAVPLKDKRILEIGSGPGNLVFFLKEQGMDARGLEPEHDFVSFAQANKVPLIEGNILSRDQGLERTPFDITLAHWTFDALMNGKSPATRVEEYQALNNLSRLTKINGISLMESHPYFSLVFSREEFELAGFEEEFTEGNLVVLKKVREPGTIEDFIIFMQRHGEDVYRIGNARIEYWILMGFFQQTLNNSFQLDLKWIIDDLALRQIKYGDQPLTLERLMGWINNSPLLASVYHRRLEEIKEMSSEWKGDSAQLAEDTSLPHDAAMRNSTELAITGATGFLGSVLSRTLENDGTNARALVLNENEAAKFAQMAPGLGYSIGGLLNIESLRRLISKKTTAFINLAGDTRTTVPADNIEESAQILETNVLGAAVALLVANDQAPAMRKIFISSFDVQTVPPEAEDWVKKKVQEISDYAVEYYENNGKAAEIPEAFFNRIAEDYSNQRFQVRPYSLSKKLMDGVLEKLTIERQIKNVIILRIMGPIGVDMVKSQASGVMMQLINAVLHSNEEWERKVTPYQGVSASLIFVDDIVKVLNELSTVKFSSQKVPEARFLELAGPEIVWDDVVDIIKSTVKPFAGELGLPADNLGRNIVLTPPEEKFRNTKPPENLDPLSQVLGKTPEITPLEKVIQDMTIESIEKVKKERDNATSITGDGAQLAQRSADRAMKTLFPAEDLMMATPLWEELKKMNGGKELKTVYLAGDEQTIVSQIDPLMKDIPDNDMVYLSISKQEPNGAITHIVIIDYAHKIRTGSVERQDNLISTNGKRLENFILKRDIHFNEYLFSLVIREYKKAKDLDGEMVSLGDDNTKDQLRDRGLMKKVFSNLELIFIKNFPGWRILAIPNHRTTVEFMRRFGAPEPDGMDSVVEGHVPNKAMMGSRGGIDLTPANMNLQTKMDSRFRGNDNGGFGDNYGGIKFHLDPAMLQELQNAPGFVPVIINVQPLGDLRKFLVTQ